MKQQDLFSAVTDAYLLTDRPLTNSDLYNMVSDKLSITDGEHNVKTVGKRKSKHNLYHRKIRWIQQSLKHSKILERVGPGSWKITNHAKIKLRSIQDGKRIIALSTNLGVCIWSKSDDVFKNIIDEPIHLLLTSPPYPLKIARAYGTIKLEEYVDFICHALEPIVSRMASGGSIALNVSNDIFETGSPARSTYYERLVIAIEDRLGLSKMDTLSWVSNKAPGPVAWASKKRYQLNVGYEPILWFCNDPTNCLADNRRVLLPHTKTHMRLIKSGGLKSAVESADGCYRKSIGSFGTPTEGKIPTNVLNFSNYCHHGRSVNRYARTLQIPPHGAKMPLSIADFLVRFLTRPGDLVVDPFAGTLTTAQAAEKNDRRWVCTEIMWEYIRQSFVRFNNGL